MSAIIICTACENRAVSDKKFFETTLVDHDGTAKKIAYFKAPGKSRLSFVVVAYSPKKIDTTYFTEASIHSDEAGALLFDHYCNSNAVGGANYIFHKAKELGSDSFYVFLRHKVDSGLGIKIEESDAATIWHYVRGISSY